MFKHLSSQASENFYDRIVRTFKGILSDRSYLNVTLDENNLQFGGFDAPELIVAASVKTNKGYKCIVASSDAKIATLVDSDGVNMLASNYLGDFTASTVLTQGFPIRAKTGKVIRDITLSEGTVWGLK
jgi:hypothetical protein